MQPDLDERLREELPHGLEVLRPLGRGATAAVYLARETELKRLVAVKVLRPQFAADNVVRSRFEREAQSAGRISHPNVTAIHRIGRLADDVPYIVMEYIEGRTVADTIEASGPFAIEDARPMLAGVASALAAAHGKGIIHRDVRPANVFIENRTDRAVLADFGIAALLESGSDGSPRLTAAGVQIGDMRHMSPEQVKGEPVTEQSDVYAFGILAYEMLTGRGPYDATSAAQHAAAHLQGLPVPLRNLRPEVDAGLAGTLERCLAKEPNRRPRASELAATLVAPPSTVPIPEPEPVGPVAQLLRELKRRRVYQILVGYAAAVFIVLQVADLILPALPLPAWSYQALVIFTLAGFPIALVLAWVYDITASGIRRTEQGREGASAGNRTRVLAFAGLALSALAAAFLGWWLLSG